MRLFALGFIAVVAGCSYSVDGTGAPPPAPKSSEPTQTEDNFTVETPAPDAPPIKASDIKNISVVIDGKAQPIGEGVVTVSGGAVHLTLRPKGSDSSYNVMFLSLDHVGTGCSRTGDNFTQGVDYFPQTASQDNDDPSYHSPPSLGCGLNILELDKRRDGRVVGIYDGELKRGWGAATNPEVVHAVIKFNVPMPAP